MDNDDAFQDYLLAREAALNAAAGHFAVANVPTPILHTIAESTTNELIALAARVVLYQRGDLKRDA